MPGQIWLLHDALPSEVPDLQTYTVQDDSAGTFKISPDHGLCILCQLEELREGPPVEEELLHWGVVLHTRRHHLRCACPHWRVLALQKTQQRGQAANVCQVCTYMVVPLGTSRLVHHVCRPQERSKGSADQTHTSCLAITPFHTGLCQV